MICAKQAKDHPIMRSDHSNSNSGSEVAAIRKASPFFSGSKPGRGKLYFFLRFACLFKKHSDSKRRRQREKEVFQSGIRSGSAETSTRTPVWDAGIQMVA